jgi:hypothetical protein
MRYVNAAEFDPAAYLARLSELVSDLPPGAARFAADPEHYNHFGLRCTKDLTISEWHHDDAGAAARIRFAGNPWKHDEDLVVDYVGVTDVTLVLTGDGPATPDGIGSVRLDEILPTGDGCSHEIEGHRGTLRITCTDLEASWYRVPRPDDPLPGSWTHEMPLGDRWNWLGRRRDGAWVVGVPHRRADPVEESMDRLVVVLDRTWRAVEERWRALPASAPALDAIVTYALTSGEWRARLAMDWLDDGYPITNVVSALALAKDDRRLGQQQRHRALRLWLANRDDQPRP